MPDRVQALPLSGRTKHWKVAALALVATGAVLYLTSGHEDAFTAKYRLIRAGTTHEEAIQQLGPSDYEFFPGVSCGDHIGPSDYGFYPGGSWGDYTCYWKSQDGTRAIVVTWALTGELAKQLVAKNGTVILSEAFEWPARTPWWERLLTRVGLR